MAEVQWFYKQWGQQRGPMTRLQLEELLANRRIGASTRVWHSGLEDWMVLATTELASSLPPTLDSSKVPDTLAWLVALSPLYFFVDKLIGSGGPYTADIVVLIIMCIDVGMLRKVGYARPPIWSVLFPFLYLFFRSRTLGRRQSALMLWIVLTVLQLAVLFLG